MDFDSLDVAKIGHFPSLLRRALEADCRIILTVAPLQSLFFY
jgi:hypothetical protein